jgi:hypothetical protein
MIAEDGLPSNLAAKPRSAAEDKNLMRVRDHSRRGRGPFGNGVPIPLCAPASNATILSAWQRQGVVRRELHQYRGAVNTTRTFLIALDADPSLLRGLFRR